MAQKLATVSTVFAACDRLDAANERWNREDVRNEVGGGGYRVIDPLIRAWRSLKPLREVAPTTPSELLHQVAASLETHIAEYTGDAENRLAESQKVFDATISELSEKLASLEADLGEKEEKLEVAEASNASLTEQLDQTKANLEAAKVENARLVTESDGLSGQVARMEKEHKTTVQSMQTEHRELLKQQAEERSRAAEEHAAALAAQRKELAAEAEQAENRLMMLLDQERVEAKTHSKKFSSDMEKMTQKAQSAREAVVALESTVKELTRQNDKLESDLAAQVEVGSELQSSLEAEKTQAASVEREFSAYKEKHKLSVDFGELQDAVAVLQDQLREKKDKKTE
jgi:chromosome segregation ATPase